MRIRLSDHFTYRRLIRFTIPSICMMIFTSIYGVIDGLFVSNFVGTKQFAAINFILPLIMVLAATGAMLGTGGAAIIGKTLGENEHKQANEYFSMIVYAAFISGIVLLIIGMIIIKPVVFALGAEGKLAEYSILYGRISLVTIPFYMMQFLFQVLFVTAEKPELGFRVTVIAGVTNIVLDALFIAVFKWGLVGAAVATGISEMLGGLLPIIYFARKNDSLLALTKTRFYGRVLLKSCTNGISEFLSIVAQSIVTVLYNWQLLRLMGDDGVAIYGIIGYVAYLFYSVFFGFSTGCAPIISYNYGAKNHDEMKNIFKKCVTFMVAAGICICILIEACAKPLALCFLSNDPELIGIAVRGIRIYSIAFIFIGFNTFSSYLFTALNNGFASAVIQGVRTLILEGGFVVLLPVIFGIDGIWCAVDGAEIIAMFIGAAFIIAYRKRYQYF